MNKKGASISKTIINLFLLITSTMRMMNHFITYIKREAQLKGRKIMVLLFLSYLMSMMLFSSWVCIQILLVLGLLNLGLGLISSVFILLLLNLVFLLSIISFISRAKAHLHFSASEES